MTRAYLVDGLRTPIGRFGGALASCRPDDLAAHVIGALLLRHPHIPGAAIEEVMLGCANQAGEDNRNVARMAALLSGLPSSVPGVTINRLCGSGLDAVGSAARMIKAGEADLVIAGGVESMTRAPFVMAKAAEAWSRSADVFDSTIGWRFINPALKAQYGVDAMPETAENVAADFAIPRASQDGFALRSQQRAAAAQKSGRLQREIAPVLIPSRKGADITVNADEHPRETTLEKLRQLPTPFRANGTVTAGNSSGVNDGAAALLIASEAALARYNLKPLACIAGMATAGVAPRVMGIGPVPATQALLARHALDLKDIGVIELNEAFAAQALACLHGLGLAEDEARVNPNGGAIALGHPLGMSGARLALTAAIEMADRREAHALAAMCVGVGQGIALLLERV